jgi:hypothetical protein
MVAIIAIVVYIAVMGGTILYYSWETGDPKLIIHAWLEGEKEALAMFANAATFHQIPSLNNYVNQVIEENGGVYPYANISMHIAAYALYLAGGAYAYNAYRAAQIAQLEAQFARAEGRALWYAAQGNVEQADAYLAEALRLERALRNWYSLPRF